MNIRPATPEEKRQHRMAMQIDDECRRICRHVHRIALYQHQMNAVRRWLPIDSNNQLHGITLYVVPDHQ